MRRHASALVILTIVFAAVWAPFIGGRPDGGPLLTMRWDFYWQYSRWLIYLSDCLRAHVYPLWCPYVAGGVPFFLNPQTQLDSPLTLLIALAVGYDFHVAQLQSVATAWAGAVGAYALAWTLWRSRGAGLVAALAFGLSTMFETNLQHLTVITGFCLAPWFLFALGRALARRTIGRWLTLTLMSALVVTSAYPSLVLWIHATGLAYACYVYRRRPRRLLPAVSALVAAAAITAIHWLPLIAYRGEQVRGTPLSIEESLGIGHMPLQQLWGLLFPFLAVAPLPTATSLDRAMLGCYCGAMALPLVALALLFGRRRTITPLAVMAAVGAMVAAGADFFGNTALHVYLPFMNFSRQTAVDGRLLLVLGLALLAAGGARLLANDPRLRRALAKVTIALAALLVGGLLCLHGQLGDAAYQQHAVGSITLELLIVAAALIALRRLDGRRLARAWIVLLVVDVGAANATNVELAGDRATSDVTMAARHQPIGGLPADWKRELGCTVARAEDSTLCEQGNFGYVDKRFYLAEYNHTRLRRFDRLMAAGFADFLMSGARVVGAPVEAARTPSDELLRRQFPVEHAIVAYAPDRVDYRVRADRDAELVFNEVYFPGWRAVLDGHELAMDEVGPGLRGLHVTAGAHDIHTFFRPRAWLCGRDVSLASLLLLVTSSGFAGLRRRRGRGRALRRAFGRRADALFGR